MLPTPSTSHINPDIIYDPAEDSFLLLDTLSSPTETHFLTQRFPSTHQHHHHHHPSSPPPSPSPSPLILEIGTGSGVILAFLTAHAQEIFGRTDILTLGTDINPYACRATRQTVWKACQEKEKEQEQEKPTTRSTCDNVGAAAAAAAGFLSAVNCDLATSIRAKMVDVLVFNPPYVPTEELEVPTTPSLIIDQQYESERPTPNDDNSDNDENTATAKRDNHPTTTPHSHSHLLTLSYAGGKNGMQTTNKLLNDLPNIINNTRGVAYILLCKQNRPDEVMERVRQWGSEWSVAVVGRSGKMAGWEMLEVIRICRDA